MMKRFVLGIVIMFGLCSFGYSDLNAIKYNYHIKRAEIHAAKAAMHAPLVCCDKDEVVQTKIVPQVYRPPVINLEIVVPRPLVHNPHIYHGQVYRSLHYGKHRAPIHAKVVTMKPYK